MLFNICNSIDSCATYLLEDGNSAREVVVLTEGQFKYVCGSSLTQEAGRILCLEKGYHGVRLIKRDIALDPTREVLQASFECNGSEDSLCECNITSSTCNISEIAVVECYLPGSYSIQSNLHYVGVRIMQTA